MPGRGNHAALTLITTNLPTLAHHRGSQRPDRHDLDRAPSWLWALLEALAYAGAAFDPAAALATQRLARASGTSNYNMLTRSVPERLGLWATA